MDSAPPTVASALGPAGAVVSALARTFFSIYNPEANVDRIIAGRYFYYNVSSSGIAPSADVYQGWRTK
jgi:hypothetical protein